MAEERDILKTQNDTMLNNSSDDDMISLSEDELDDILIDVDLNNDDLSFDTNDLLNEDSKAADIESAADGTLDIDDINLSDGIMIDGAETDIPLDSEYDTDMVNIDDFTVGDVIPEEDVINSPDNEMITADDLSSNDMISIDDLSSEIDNLEINDDFSSQDTMLEEVDYNAEVSDFETETPELDEEFDITPASGYFDESELDDNIALSEDELDGLLESSEVEYTDDSVLISKSTDFDYSGEINSDISTSDFTDDYIMTETAGADLEIVSAGGTPDNTEIVILDGRELNLRLGESEMQTDYIDTAPSDEINITDFTVKSAASDDNIFDEDVVEEDVFDDDFIAEETKIDEISLDIPEYTETAVEDTTPVDVDIDLVEPEETFTEISEEEILSIDDLDEEGLYEETTDISLETAAASVESDTIEAIDDFDFDGDEALEDIEIVEEIPDESFGLSISESTLDSVIQEEIEMGTGDLEAVTVDEMDEHFTGETISIDDIENELNANGISLDVPEENTIESLDMEDGFAPEEYIADEPAESSEMELEITDELDIDIDNVTEQVFDEQLDENIEREILLDDFSEESGEPEIIDISAQEDFSSDYKTEIQDEIDSAAEVISLDLEETGQAAEDYDFDYKPDEPIELSEEPEFVEDVISEELVETITVDAEIPQPVEPPVKKQEQMSPEGMAAISKTDLKEMLLYIDNLFGDLPEDKIKEFAKSKFYDLYNKVFDDLGI